MTLAILIYLVSLLPSLSTLLLAGGITAAGSIVAYGFIWLASQDMGGPNRIKWNSKIPIRLGIFSIVCFVLMTFIPKERTAWLMIGGYAAQTVYQSEDGQRYRALIMKKIDAALAESIDEVKTNDKTSKKDE